MAVGEIVEHCRIDFRESVAREWAVRQRQNVTIEHVAKNTIEIRFPRGKTPVRKRIGSKSLIEARDRNGRDLLEAWRDDS